MKIKIGNAHKSIPLNLEFDLPLFTVMTGENGSGKTHLFEAIKDPRNGLVTLEGKRLKTITYIPFGGLNPQVDENCNPAQVANKVKEVWNSLRNHIPRPTTPVMSVDGSLLPENDPALHRISKPYKDAILNVAKRAQVMPSELTEDLIADHISMKDLQGNNLFNSQFALIFKTYHVRQYDNKLNKLYQDEGLDTQKYLDKEKFEEKYGEPPWEFVNTILKRLNLPYTVNSPIGSKRDSDFSFKLVHKHSSIEIGTQDLSTGERTLMSLALAMYNSTSTGDRTEMLILDEPDAPLHPSMSKLMLEIIEEEIVNKHGIPVLLSTHSPTTIACTPASSLYKITQANKVPERCNLDDSIKILTYGIPNLRVSMEKRRQVFVEHNYDAAYYEALFDILSRIENFTTTPQFLPPHTLNGSNCEAVIEITQKLRDMGNNQIYGLIDWDLKNTPSQQIVILGMGNRYAIENYIFEPHILGLYLIYKKFASPADLGLASCSSYLEACSLITQDPAMIQSIATAVEARINWNSENTQTTKSVLISGNKVLIRDDVLTLKGHDYEALCKKTWPQLNGVRDGNYGDSALKRDVIRTVINDFPSLMSMDILTTMRQFL